MRSISDTRRILPYLRSARGAFETEGFRSGRRSHVCPSVRPDLTGSAASTGLVVALMVSMGLLENACNHLVQRRVLNAHVEDRVPVEYDAEHLGHARPLDPQVRHRPVAADHLTKAGQIIRRCFPA